MENEKKLTNSDETSLESRDFDKEFWYLNQLEWLINFDLLKKSALSEYNFYSSIARYIDIVQKANIKGRENNIKALINKLKQYEWDDEYKKIMQIDTFLSKLKIERYNKHNYWVNAKLLEKELDNFQYTYEKNEDGKIDRIFPWIVKEAIPERFYIRSIRNNKADKLLKENRSALSKSIREQRKKADDLAKKL